ncbi:MAG TPA: polysaccharide deacetylase family protein [bacterium]|nr:polysaccharide deacetylase family protein [bacterium]HPR88356.1 polysaccharide deacetylase family protein [bacterium]
MPILAYHMVEPRFDLAITRVTPAQFAAQLDALLQAGYTVLPLREFMQLRGGRERSVALTFDDAYASVYRYAFPILRGLSVRATLFVPAGYIGKMDDWDVNFGRIRFAHMEQDQIRELAAAGWEIGSHSLHHWDLTRLSPERLEEEVGGSKQVLEKLSGGAVEAISYPFGNTDARVVASCKRAGYRLGVVMARLDAKLEVNFVLPRFGVYLYDLPPLFKKKVFGKHEKLFKFIQRGIDFCSDGTVLVKQGFGKPRKSA